MFLYWSTFPKGDHYICSFLQSKNQSILSRWSYDHTKYFTVLNLYDRFHDDEGNEFP